MSRSKLWTMRLFAASGHRGHNVRFKEILRGAATGCRRPFTLPTLMAGTPTTHILGGGGPLRGAVDTLADVEDLFAAITSRR